MAIDPRVTRALLCGAALLLLVFFAGAIAIAILVDSGNDHYHHSGSDGQWLWPRSIEGYGVRGDDLGATDAPMRRLSSLAPGLSTDETSVFYPSTRVPPPRELSNNFSASTGNASGPCDGEATSDCHVNTLVMSWWQFYDHDVALTSSSGESMNIVVNESGTNKTVPFTRAAYVYSNEGATPPRRQPVDSTTPFLDASHVYGSDEERARALRTFRDGELKMLGSLLPLNGGEAEEVANDADPSISDPHAFYFAGDTRSNEQRILLSLHTLVVREHNRIARAIVSNDLVPRATDVAIFDEHVYQLARAAVIGQLQRIHYCEAAPALLGSQLSLSFDACDDDDSNDPRYDPTHADPRMPVTLNVLLRNMHSMIPSVLAGTNITEQFFRPSALALLGSDPLATVFNVSFNEATCRIDPHFVDAIRNMLFGTMCEDLFARNVQRARDVGAPYYNDARVAYSLAPRTDFTSIPELESVYGGNLSNVEVFPASLAEPHPSGSCVGELTATAINHFLDESARADPFFFTNANMLAPGDDDDDAYAFVKSIVRHGTMRRLIVRNTALTESDVPADVWHVNGGAI